MRFDSRPDAIIHYKQRHAIHSVLCQFCNKPIRIDIQCDGFAKHFRNMHPDQEIPYGLGKRTNRSTDQVFHAEKVRSRTIRRVFGCFVINKSYFQILLQLYSVHVKITPMISFYYRHAVKLPSISFQKQQNNVPSEIVSSNFEQDLIASLIIKICMPKVQFYVLCATNRFKVKNQPNFKSIGIACIQTNRFLMTLQRKEYD